MDISHEQRKRLLLGAEILAISLALFIGVFLFLAFRTLPGDMLYGTKVGVLEEGIELAYVSPHSEAEYHLGLLEQRFRELKKIGERGNVVPGDVWYFHNELNERTDELVGLLAAEEGEGITLEEIIMYNHRTAAILRTIEQYVEETDALAFFEEGMEDSRREAGNMFDDRVDQFVRSASAAEVQAFVTKLLESVQRTLEGETINSVLREEVSDFLDRAVEYMREDDAAGAIKKIEDALRVLEVAKYLGTTELEPEVLPRPKATSTPEVISAPVVGTTTNDVLMPDTGTSTATTTAE